MVGGKWTGRAQTGKLDGGQVRVTKGFQTGRNTVGLHFIPIDLVSVWKMNPRGETKSRQIHWVRNEECLYYSSDGGKEKGSGFGKYLGVKLIGIIDLGSEVCIYMCIYVLFFF